MVATSWRVLIGACALLLFAGCSNEADEQSSVRQEQEPLSVSLVSGTQQQQGAWKFVKLVPDLKSFNQKAVKAEIECTVEGKPVFIIEDARGNISFADWRKNESGAYLVTLSHYYNHDVPLTKLIARLDGHIATWPLTSESEKFDWPSETVYSDKFDVFGVPVELVWLNAYVQKEDYAFNGKDLTLTPLGDVPNDGMEYRVHVATPYNSGSTSNTFDLRKPKDVYLEQTGQPSMLAANCVVSEARGVEFQTTVTLPSLSMRRSGKVEDIEFELAGRKLKLVLTELRDDSLRYAERHIKFEVQGDVKANYEGLKPGTLLLTMDTDLDHQCARWNTDNGAGFDMMSSPSGVLLIDEYELKIIGLLVADARVRTVVVPVRDAREPIRSSETP